MSRINEPNRVIMRGRTRTIGEPRRVIEGSGTPATRAQQSTPERLIGKPRGGDDGKGRFAQGEKREPPARNVPPPREPGPRTVSDERRPLDRIADLEGKVSELWALIVGSGPVADGEPLPLVEAVNHLEEVSASLAESVGELMIAKNDTVPPGAEHAAELAVEPAGAAAEKTVPEGLQAP